MKFYSHRGFKAKENTLLSFKNSFKNFDGVEFDVRLTRDNIPVVIHDYNLSRTHNLKTIIHLSDYKDLKKFNLPLLIDTLLLIQKNKKYCLIDIKVKENSKYILEYLYNLNLNKIINSNILYCIVYTDNIPFLNNIKLLRAYHLLIPNNINTKFIGISVQYNGSKLNINSINNFLNYVDKHKKKFHLNLYITSTANQNIDEDEFLINLKNNFYNEISLTSDEIIIL